MSGEEPASLPQGAPTPSHVAPLPTSRGAAGSLPSLSGPVRELSSRGWRRVVGLLSLWIPVRSGASLLAHALLGYRRKGTLSLTGGQLHLHVLTRILGWQLRQREVVLLPAQLSAIEVGRGVPGRTVAAALFALALGTTLGTGLLAAGFSAPGLAPSLLGLGLLLVMAGVLVDYALLRRTAGGNKAEESTVVRVELPSGRGFELTGVDPAAAADLLQLLRTLLA